MIFQSLDFLVFLVLVVGIHWALPSRLRGMFLLAASYVFYGYVHPWFLFLLWFVTVAVYVCALGIERIPRLRKEFLWLGVGACLSLLGAFKYFNFFVENAVFALNSLGLNVSRPELQIVLPVGISFFAFQGMSYVIDVYWGKVRARSSFVSIALFKAFFPLLVAGPIERATHLLPQLEADRTLRIEMLVEGLLLMVWGFFKKLVIADNVSLVLARASGLPPIMGRCFRVLHTDIRGLLGLHGHRPRHLEDARHQRDRQFPASVCGQVADGLLATLAHFPVDLVPRLCVYPAGRESRRPPARSAQRAAHISPERSLARGELELRGVGRLLGLSHRRLALPGQLAAGAPVGHARSRNHPGRAHVRAHEYRLAVVPGDRFPLSPERPEPVARQRFGARLAGCGLFRQPGVPVRCAAGRSPVAAVQAHGALALRTFASTAMFFAILVLRTANSGDFIYFKF